MAEESLESRAFRLSNGRMVSSAGGGMLKFKNWLWDGYSSKPLGCWGVKDGGCAILRHDRRRYPNTRYLVILYLSVHTARTQAIHRAVGLG